jgi:FlaA1/EpsC-like NDP-sugar epimerase
VRIAPRPLGPPSSHTAQFLDERNLVNVFLEFSEDGLSERFIDLGATERAGEWRGVPDHAQLLGRDERSAASAASRDLVGGKRVLVTGAAGSIGSEIVRQVTRLGADRVFLLDHDESRMLAIALELSGSGLLQHDDVVLADIRDRRRVRRVFEETAPDVVYHAAAHKHLPILERYPWSTPRSSSTSNASS